VKAETKISEAPSRELATCHCIIGHPDKAKFLAIRHKTGWSVPTLKFPPGSIDLRVAMITQGMKEKYGLNTRVLRPRVKSSRYHCIELELASGGGNKKLDAVWVDRDQYHKFRSERDVPQDPFDEWLQERERAAVPALRPAWQIAGWFAQADHWIHFQAERLGLQVTGGVQQFKVGWYQSCVMRVPTSGGMLFFKAAYAKPPGEAALTEFLAEKWPQYIPRPLAVDAGRNWLLTRDMAADGELSPDLSLLPDFARVLARIQVESTSCTGRLNALGCPVRDLQFLLNWTERKDELLASLRDGQKPLSEPELLQLAPALAAFVPACRQLLELPLPAALVHNDFRDANQVVQGSCLRIFDWSNAVIAHPFMAMEYLNSPRASVHSGGVRYTLEDATGQAIVREANSAYLESFLAWAPMPVLQQAWALAQSLFPLWNLSQVHDKFAWVDRSDEGYELVATQLQHNARKVITVSQEMARRVV
jgi:hypothetical protein